MHRALARPGPRRRATQTPLHAPPRSRAASWEPRVHPGAPRRRRHRLRGTARVSCRFTTTGAVGMGYCLSVRNPHSGGRHTAENFKTLFYSGTDPEAVGTSDPSAS